MLQSPQKPRGNQRRQVLSALAFGLALTLTVTPAEASNINLGGQRTDGAHMRASTELPYKVPENVVALPTLVAPVLDAESGRWKQVRVDAYLEPSDDFTRQQMRLLIKDIVARAQPSLKATPAAALQAVRNGPQAARDCIRQAAEESLGRSWRGMIYIRSLAVY